MNAIEKSNLLEWEKQIPEGDVLENIEQVFFVKWLEFAGLKFSSIPNSTWTPSRKQKAKNKEEGLREGLPDLFIIIEEDQSLYGRSLELWVELKRKKSGCLQKSQEIWLEKLNKVEDTAAKECKGAIEAIKFVKKYLII